MISGVGLFYHCREPHQIRNEAMVAMIIEMLDAFFIAWHQCQACLNKRATR